MKNFKIALCVSGTFCQLDKVNKVCQELINMEAEVIPVFSEKVLENYKLDSEWEKEINKLKSVTNKIDYNKPLFIQIEKLTKNKNIDAAVVISTGNTLSKISNSISDDNIPFLVKGLQRNNRPIIIAVTTNDGLGLNLINIGKLLNTKNFYFVPFKQDNPIDKPHSLGYDLNLVIETIEYAFKKEQIQPIISQS